MEAATGSRFWPPDQAEIMRDVESKFMDTMRSWGYREVIIPSIITDKEGKGLRVLDNRGNILSFRPDLTTAIGQMVEKGYLNGASTLRVCSRGPVYKLGRECHQVGAELLGDNALETDLEMLQLAVACMSRLYDGPITLVLGAPQLVPALLTNHRVDQSLGDKLIGALRQRDLVLYNTLLRSMPLDTRVLLQELPQSKPLKTVVAELELEQSEECQSFLSLLSRLQECDFGDSIAVNLGLTGHFDYYTGFVFEIYLPGVGQSIMSGGRYSVASRPAVGMAFDLETLLSVLTANGDKASAKGGNL